MTQPLSGPPKDIEIGKEYSLKEAAYLVGITPNGLIYNIEKGRLFAEKKGAVYCIQGKDLLTYRNRRLKNVAPKLVEAQPLSNPLLPTVSIPSFPTPTSTSTPTPTLSSEGGKGVGVGVGVMNKEVLLPKETGSTQTQTQHRQGGELALTIMALQRIQELYQQADVSMFQRVDPAYITIWRMMVSHLDTRKQERVQEMVRALYESDTGLLTIEPEHLVEQLQSQITQLQGRIQQYSQQLQQVENVGRCIPHTVKYRVPRTVLKMELPDHSILLYYRDTEHPLWTVCGMGYTIEEAEQAFRKDVSGRIAALRMRKDELRSEEHFELQFYLDLTGKEG